MKNKTKQSDKSDTELDILTETQKNKLFFLKCFEKSMAIIAPACDAANICRDTFYRWYREDPWFKEKVDEIKEMQKDYVESALLNNIKHGKELSTMFYLKTKAKDRGYVEKQEVEPILPKDYIFKIEVVNGNQSEAIPKTDDGPELPNGQST